MADFEKLLLQNDSDDEVTEVTTGGTAHTSADNAQDDDFYRQLAAVNSLPASRATPEPPAAQAVAAQQTLSSPPANKATLILDPTEVLAQQQKAAANRSPAGSQAVSAGVSNATASYKLPQQHMAQMAGHASGMMYRPVASAAPQQPAQVNGTAKPGHAGSFSYYQQLLAFADQRWKETNQTQKRHEARNLVGKAKQDKSTSANLPAEIMRLVGDELVHEFKLTNGSGLTVKHSQEALVSGQQQPGRSQQMRSQQQAAPGAHQLPGIPPVAASQAPIPGMQAARQQQPMVQAQLPHMANMGRGTGPSLAGAPSHPMPQGPIKQEGLHPGGLQGQHTMRAASPPMRAMSPAMPGGLTQAQLLQNQHQQQQQAALLHGQQMTGGQMMPGSRPVSAKRPASAPVIAPAAKRQATKQEDKPNTDEDLDVLQGAGVDEDDEREAMFEQARPTAARGPAPAPPRLLNSHPLQLKVQEAVKQYNIQGIHPRLHAYLNQAVWLHMEGLVAQACKMASQRADLSRKQEGMQMTTDVRKALGEKTRLERDKALAKEEAARKALLEASKSKDKDGDESTQRKVKEAQKEELDRQNKLQTNMALKAAFGGARWQNFGKAKSAGPKAPALEASAAATATSSTIKPEETGPAKAAPMTLAERAAARPQPSRTPPPPAAAAQPGASRSLLPPSRLAPEGQMVGLKDLIAVMEHHPIYCKSDHLYQLYDRLDHP
ncbi:TPA: hypothetical protein ACH3X2_012666 [Trebouxia sp. C0005]